MSAEDKVSLESDEAKRIAYAQEWIRKRNIIRVAQGRTPLELDLSPPDEATMRVEAELRSFRKARQRRESTEISRQKEEKDR